MDRLRRRFLSSFSPLPSEPVDRCLLICAAFFLAGLQPRGCTKQLIEIEAGRPFAWTGRLQAFGLRLRKSCVPHAGYSKRRAHAPGSVAEFLVGSARGQSRGKVVKFHANLNKAAPRRGPIQAARSGTLAHGCIAGSESRTLGFLQHPWWRSSQAALVRRSGSPARSAGSVMVRACSGLLYGPSAPRPGGCWHALPDNRWPA